VFKWEAVKLPILIEADADKPPGILCVANEIVSVL
jgi:hypothetical protein